MYFLFFNVKAWEADVSSKARPTVPPPPYGGNMSCSPLHFAFLTADMQHHLPMAPLTLMKSCREW